MRVMNSIRYTEMIIIIHKKKLVFRSFWLQVNLYLK